MKKFVLRKYCYIIASVSGMIWQMYFICSAYFSYTVITDFNVSRHELIRPPNFVFCFDPFRVRNKETFEFQGDIWKNRSVDVDLIVETVPKPFDDDVFFGYFNPTDNLTVEAGQGITLKDKGIYNHFKVKYFTKRWQLCYDFQLKQDKIYSRSFIVDRRKTSAIYHLRFWNYWFENISDFKIYFYDREDKKFLEKIDTSLNLNREVEKHPLAISRSEADPEKSSTGLEEIVTEKEMIEGREVEAKTFQPSKLTITYTRYESNLLPWPHASQCKDYKREGFASRDDCFYQCSMQLFRGRDYTSFDLFQERSGNITGNKTKQRLLLRKDKELDESLKKQLSKRSSFCTKRCYLLDCYRTEYLPKLVSTVNTLNGSITDLSISIPIDQDFVIHTKPLMGVIDFVTYVLSSISFWIGFAPYEFLSEHDVIEISQRFISDKILKTSKTSPSDVKEAKMPARSSLIAERIQRISNVDSSEESLRLFIILLHNWFEEKKKEMEILLKKAQETVNGEMHFHHEEEGSSFHNNMQHDTSFETQNREEINQLQTEIPLRLQGLRWPKGLPQLTTRINLN